MATPPHPFLRLLRYALINRKLVASALVLMMIATVADVAGPLLIKVFIDDYVVPGQWDIGPITGLALLYIVLLLIAAATTYWQDIRFNLIAVNAVQQLREQVFAKVVNLPVSYFDRTPTGTLVSRITNDTEHVKDLYVQVLGIYVQNIVRIAGIFIAMAWLDWRLMLVCATLIPMVIVLMLVYQRLSTPLVERARALLSDINARLHESIQGIKIIQLFSQQQHFRQRFAGTADDHFRARLRVIKLDSLMLRAFVDFLHMLVLAGLLMAFGYQALSSPVEIGVIYAFVTYLGRFIEPIIEMIQRLNIYQRAVVSGGRVLELIDTPATDTPPQNDNAIVGGDIAFSDVTFSYDGKRNVLKNIAFNIPPGRFFGIVGHTGSGKSTIANLLLRFYEPNAGEILIDNRPLNLYSEENFRDGVGIVQQDAFIFSGTVRDNITLNRPLNDTALIDASRQAGLHEHVMRLPDGYDTVMNERGGNLSAGQRQLLALARTLARQPKVLILDEATANIDSHTEAAIQNALTKLHGKVTLLVIAHRLSTIEKADQILVMHHGELLQRGSHRQLLDQQGMYRSLYEMQALAAAHD